MSDRTCQFLGLVGFIVAGVLFVVIGIRDGDLLVTIASVIWTLACCVWLWPLIRKP